MISTAVAGAILIALLGWFATIFAISNSRLNGKMKRLLLLPSWIPWLVLALGAPIISGILSLDSALNIGGAMTTGMAISLVMSRWQRTKR